MIADNLENNRTAEVMKRIFQWGCNAASRKKTPLNFARGAGHIYGNCMNAISAGLTYPCFGREVCQQPCAA